MITKTKFKNYSRCPRFSALDRIHRDKEEANIDGKYADVKDLLGYMFDGSEDLINITDDQMEAMLPYFNKLEEVSAKVVENYFEGDITYSLNTKDQKAFDCWGENYQYICYTDIFLEQDDSFIIFETKATTTNKFKSLKYKEDKEDQFIFEKIDNTYILKEDLDPSYEITKSYMKQRKKMFDKYNATGKYIYDLAIQRWIIENSLKQNDKLDLIDKVKYYLVVLNNEYTFDGSYVDDEPNYEKINNQEIVSFIDLTSITKEYQSSIDAEVQTVEKYLDYLESKPYNLGPQCERKKSTQCKYFDICWDKVPKKNSILTYIDNHHGFKDESDVKHLPLDLINDDKVNIDDIPASWLHREKNQIQREVYESNEIYVKKNKIIDGVNIIKFPVYHLDFESFPCPLPRFNGEKPYNQSVFQYSLHIQTDFNECDKHTNHYEFLAGDSNDNRYELVKSMVDNIGSTGSIVVWNQAFEIARMKEFAEFYPEFKEVLYQMIDRVFDLMYVLKSNTKLYTALGYSEESAKLFNYYHEDLQGSYSIKKVLPIFSNLTYKDMEVGNGMEAVVAYINLHKLKGEEYKNKYNALLAYCKQDTWAMVEILDNIKVMVD
ncbi:DUF2779 domain-containing protein [Mycoplasmatota bacterium WC44]